MTAIRQTEIMKRALVSPWFILFFASLLSPALSNTAIGLDVAQLQLLQQQKEWDAILQATTTGQTPDEEYYRGFALARLQRWSEAKTILLRGLQSSPKDPRFPVELAGVSFHIGDRALAKSFLRRALELNAQDAYTNDFLATIYFLEENTEASLKHWNKVDKPHINEIRIEPEPRIDPVLLDRAFTVSPSATLHYADYLETEARLKSFAIFQRLRLQLYPEENGEFDLVVHTSEKNGIGSNKVDAVLSVFRDLPYQTIHADVFNIGKRGINTQSLARWAARKSRLFASLSAPFASNPHWRYQLFADARREYWDLPADPDLFLELQHVGFELRSVGRASWRNEVSLSHRNYRDSPDDSDLYAEGYSFQYIAGMDREVIRIPESRWKILSFATVKLGTMFAQSDLFTTLETGMRSEWFPQSKGNDDALRLQFRIGKGFGAIPFDELFTLGMQTDNNLWLRAHTSLHGEKKATFPIGKSYALLNSEFDKRLFRTAFFRVILSPFFDAGKTSADLSSQSWQFDMGLQWKVRVLESAAVNFCFGRNLRTGHNSFYFTLSSL